MPIHEYHCPSCGAHFDYLARRPDDRPSTCAKCGKSSRLTRELSTFSARVAQPAAPSPACGTCPGASMCGGACGAFDN